MFPPDRVRDPAAARIVDLYDRTADAWAAARGERLLEGAWLDRLTASLAPDAHVLDLGYGNGRPIAAALLAHRLRVTGADSSAAMIARATQALPEGEWIVADMRELALGRRFDAVLAWHSFFHLDHHDQRLAVARFAEHARVGAPLIFTSGQAHGVAMGEWCGEPLYHASLSPDGYRALLDEQGFDVEGFDVEGFWPGAPPEPTVWLARRR